MGSKVNFKLGVQPFFSEEHQVVLIDIKVLIEVAGKPSARLLPVVAEYGKIPEVDDTIVI